MVKRIREVQSIPMQKVQKRHTNINSNNNPKSNKHQRFLHFNKKANHNHIRNLKNKSNLSNHHLRKLSISRQKDKDLLYRVTIQCQV